MSDSYKLSDIYELQMGKTPSRDISDYWADGQYDWISIADLSKCEKYINQTKERITNRAIEESGIKVIPTDTIIMSFKLSIGKVAITQRPVYSNEAIMAFIDKGVTYILPQYAFYLFSAQKWDKGTNRAVMGATLNKATLSQYRVSIHNADEQAEIVNRLNKITDLINFRRKQIQKIDDLVKSQFIEMFGDMATNSKSWTVVPLSDISAYFNGLTYKPENVSPDGLIVLRSSNIQDGELDFADIVRVDSTVKEKLYVRDGDILMCSRNGSAKLVGKVAQIRHLNEPATFGAFMMIIRTEFPEFLITYFRMPVFREQIKVGATTIINQITSSMLDKIKLPLPPKPLISRFARFVEQTDKSKVLIREHLFLINRLRKVEKT